MNPPVYIGYEFKINPLQPASEILIAELGLVGFESFVENPEGVTAYIQKNDWNAFILDDIQILNSSEFSIAYTFNEIKQTNWNAEWEKNFQPIVVDDQVTVRAPFHDKPKTKYDIIIEPKMSFGTGHHETTSMMLEQLLEMDLKGKSVLDMGCGTGVLAILAEKMGATSIDAIDIDPWSFENTTENIQTNDCRRIKPILGDASLLKKNRYDVILANINRNILLRNLEVYVKSMKNKAVLLLSGFYDDDLPLMVSACLSFKLLKANDMVRNNWCSAKFYSAR